MTIDIRERPARVPQVNVLDATPRVSKRTRTRNHRLTISLAVLVGAGAALFSDAAPAGIALADGVYRALFGSAVIWFASRSRRWTWAFLAGLATVSAATLLTQIVALGALVIAGWSLRRPRRAHLAGAVVAAMSMPALLTQGAGPLWRLSGGHLSDPFAMSALITLVATAPVVRSGWRTLSRRKRRTIRTRSRYLAWAIVGVFVGSGVVSAAAVPAMLDGLDQTRLAAEYAQDGKLDEASAEFESATESWNRSNAIISGPWMVPARLVPVLGQHVRAAQVTSGQASAITQSAATTTSRVDPDLLITNGSLDIAELDRITPAVDAFAATLDRAAVRIDETNSTWLLPPIGSRIDRAFEILNPAAGVVGVAAEALHVGSDLLGGETPSRMLIMFTTPAEARGSGGFVGNWAVASMHDGELSIEEQYRTRELNALLAEQNPTLTADADYLARYARFDIEQHIQDVAISPDFPSVAPVAASLFEQATGTGVDAVLSIDPFVIQQLLQFSGPLERSGDRPLTGSNAAQELLVQQYIDFGDDEANREAELSELTTTLLSQLLDSPPDPIAFASELAPLAQQQRLALWLADDFDGSIASRLGLDGAFPRPTEDLFGVIHQNAGQNKIDSFLERTVSISTELYPTNNLVHHDVTITLDNSAPTTGLPEAILASNDQGLDPGTNRMILSVYTALPIVDARINGEAIPVQAETEFDTSVYSFVITIPAGEFRVLDLQLSGSIDLADGYEMSFAAQPTVTPDAYSWHVRSNDNTRLTPPDDWTSSADGVRWAAALDRHKAVEIDING